MPVQTTTRNASLEDLANLLRDQHARKVDMVAPASKIKAVEGNLVVTGTEAVLSEDGVTTTDGVYRPTIVCDEGIADKFKIPVSYVRTLRDSRVDLFDANVNGWLHGRRAKQRLIGGDPGQGTAQYEMLREGVPGDQRSFLLRAFRGDDGEIGVARAFLSDSYKVIDNLDVLTAALDGVRAAGVEIDVNGCDLTDRRMYVRISAPEVTALAPDLLRGYRSPFTGQTGDDNPTVFAGFEISNSEVGSGAFSIVPRMVVQVCNNGLKITKDAMRAVHLGSKMDEGIIRWSDETQETNLALVRSKTRDAVATFLDVDYMRHVITEMQVQAGVPVTNVADHVKMVGRRMLFTEEQTAGVLDHFIKGGQVTSGGVLAAVTSYAQTIDDADTAAKIEESAFKAMEYSATIA